MRPFALSFLLLLCSSLVFSQPLRFAMPLKGIQGRDYFIDNYVDHDTTAGILDPYCGTKTYDGHKGADMILRSFKTMDSGIYVYAAADGVVVKLHDGEYDRNKRWVKGRPPNRIGILHKDKYVSYYLHLMKNSMLVKVGDSVKMGQPIAKVGSSGYSTQAHLHFEVRDSNDRVVDPFAGNCQAQTPSMWIEQPAYDTALYVIDQGFAPYHDNEDTLKERYLVRDTFYIGEDAIVAYWVFMHGRLIGKTGQVEWYTPKGKVHSVLDFPLKSGEHWHSYAWPYIKMPTMSGEWMVRLKVDGKYVAGRYFYVMRRRD